MVRMLYFVLFFERAYRSTFALEWRGPPRISPGSRMPPARSTVSACAWTCEASPNARNADKSTKPTYRIQPPQRSRTGTQYCGLRPRLARPSRSQRGYVLGPYPIPKAQNPKPKKAEREGFEPSRRLNTAYAISNPKPPAPLRAVPYRYAAYLSPKHGPLGGARTVAYRPVPTRLQYGYSK